MARKSAKKVVEKAKTPVAKKKASRTYSAATLKKLSMLSGNHCAFPGCTNQLVVGALSGSGKEVIGQICHIYGASEDGPRGKSGLTTKEKNAFENLILMCGHHHPIIDNLEGDYPAETLFSWKREHEARAMAGTPEAIKQEEDVQKHTFYVEMSDEKIEEALARIRHGRHLAGFPTVDETITLAAQVERTRLSGGHDEVRARALAWCARLLSAGQALSRANELLAKSKQLAGTSEATIAEAFILAGTDKTAALTNLAKLNSPAARSAMLRIVTNADQPEKAVAWAKSAGLTIDSFDPEGKFLYIMNAFIAGDWDAGLAGAETISEAHFSESPILLHAVAMAKLISTIEPELRGSTLVQVPFEAGHFPLASQPKDWKNRREAGALFARISAFACSLGVAQASNLASDYALWLELRDPVTQNEALETLRDSMRDPETSLRRLNLALQFGIKPDVKAIEARIDQNLALTGGLGTAEEAFARFSLAFAQGSYKGVADYIAKHRAQLYAHLNKSAIIGIEIETLARGGLTDSAREKLDEATSDGLSKHEQETLARIIAEQRGADPIGEWRALYEARRDLQSLTSLIHRLEEKELQQDLLPYAEELLRRTRSVEACERVARCLNDLARYDQLAQFLVANSDLVAQSENLGVLWAWTLYHEGRFDDVKEALEKIPKDSRNPNIKNLRINIAIASGTWDSLVTHVNDVWANRDMHTAAELLQTAHLSLAVNGPHSKGLIIAATEKEPDNPEILASAYFQATNAGWEQSDDVAAWMSRAAELSGDKGPIKMVSLKELLDMQPEWDKRSNSVWEQLKTAKIPCFAAAQLLNRSLLDFYLVPTLVNPTETDVRRRSIVFAYSGARKSLPIQNLSTIALDLGALVTLSRLDLLDTVVERFEVIIPNTTLGWLFQERQKATFHQPSRIRDAELLKRLVANKTLDILNVEGPRNDALIREVGADTAAMLSAAKARTSADRKILLIRGAPIQKVGSLMMEEADVSDFAENLTSCFAVIDRMKAKGALTASEEQNARAYLRLHATPWPHEPQIDDSTEIYLDGLAVSSLRAAGVLGKMKMADIKAFIDNPENEEAEALIALQSLGTQQLDAIEAIRASLSKGIASKRIRAVRTMKADDEEDTLLKLHPTYGVLGLSAQAQAIVVDDRFVNQHQTMTMANHTAPVLTTLDVLDHLHSANTLSLEQLFAHRTTLRQWGYQLIPVTDEELSHHLSNATISNGELVETAELRAIRESLLRAKMGKLLQLPTEMQFLQQSLGAIHRVMKQKWVAVGPDDARAVGDYLLSLAKVRTWAASALAGNERGFAMFGYAGYALQLVSLPPSADQTTQNAYYDWVEDRILKSIKGYEPEVFKFMLEQSRSMAIDFANKMAAELAAELDRQ